MVKRLKLVDKDFYKQLDDILGVSSEKVNSFEEKVLSIL